jgi:tetratricopeptide (TPR) repeat protein
MVKAAMTRQAGHDFQTGLPIQQVDRLELDQTVYATADGQRKPVVRVVASSRNRLTIMKGEASTLSSNGYSLAEKKQAAEALAELDKAIAVQPDCALLYGKRGDIRRMFEDYQGAIKDFDQAIKIDPELDEGYRGRGCARMLAEDLPGAIADYTELIRRQPELWRYYYYRAGLYEDQKKYDLALVDLKAALERNLDDPNLYRARAVVYWKAGHKAAGDADMAKFNELNSDHQ